MNVAQATLDALRKAVGSPSDELAKAFTQSGSPTTGLTYYDLEAPAKTLYPVLTPLRNTLSRVSGKGGTQANWKAVTKINVGRIGLGIKEGARGRIIDTEVKEYFAKYVGLGLEDNVSFEAQYAGQNFEDIRVRATEGLLRSFMIGEEAILLGGNGVRSLGVTPTPTTTAAAGGALSAATLSVICIALTLEAYLASGVTANGVPVSGNQTMADGSTQFVRTGTCGKSSAASQAVTLNQKLTASVAAVRGAVAYAWYVGTAGNERIEKITTINSVEILSLIGTGQLASAHSATDYSANTDVHDGFLAFASDSNGGGYYNSLAAGTAGVGTPLTGSGDGGIAQFDEALKFFWDMYKLAPDEIWVGSQEMKNIRAKIMASPSNAAQRFVFNVEQGTITGGSMAVSYLNPFSMTGAKEIPIKLHPNMPDGTVLFRTMQLPYQANGVPEVARVLERQSYYSIEWPLRSRKYEMGVYADQVMQCFAPFSLGMITNIGNG